MSEFVLIVCGVVLATFFTNTVFGCTLVSEALTNFDETEYIFIGEVTDYTNAIKSPKLNNDAYGLVVKVKESVYLPKISKTHFEVFPIQLWADCSEGGTRVNELKKDFQIGSEIRVIAKAAQLIPNDSTGKNIRLEIRPGEIGSIALNYDENKQRMTSVNSIFDYKSFKYSMEKDSVSKYLLPSFELRKDLLRLKNSKTQKERTETLNRLKKMPICCNNLDFQVVFNKYNFTHNQ